MSVDVRLFSRADREQVSALANAHVSAVVPNGSVSVNALLSQLEREPGEFIVDPWVRERVTLVAVQRSRVVAAALLLRYVDDDRTTQGYRDAAEIRWLLCWPPAPFWPDSMQAGSALARACVAQLARWRPARTYADGALPAPGVYGVPEQWPHVRELYSSVGFVPSGRTEVVSMAAVSDLPTPDRAPIAGLVPVRRVGVSGTRISAVLDGSALGYVEVDTAVGGAGRPGGDTAWADIGNLYVEPTHRRTGIATWLLAEVRQWLTLGGVTRLLEYNDASDHVALAFAEAIGFRPLTRTECGFVLRPVAGGQPTSAR